MSAKQKIPVKDSLEAPETGGGSNLHFKNARESTLLTELEALLANPRVDEIVANDWLHDGSLPVPSLDLIRYLGCRMLTGYGIKLAAASMERYALISNLVDHLRNESPEDRSASIPSILRRLDCFRFLNTGKKGVSDPYTHEWLPILWPFLYPDALEGDAAAVAHAAGERVIARGMIETMTLRAIFTQDFRRIASLANAMRMIRAGKDHKPTTKNRIMGEILRSTPYLVERLGGRPSTSVIEAFVRRCAEFNGQVFAIREHDFNAAFKELEYPDKPGDIKIDEHLITKLAHQASSLAG